MLEREVALLYSQLLYKPPEHPHTTPWHQDAAYLEMPYAEAGRKVASNSLQFWLALDDADEENGCMHFHPPPEDSCLLPHYVVSGDEDNDARLLGLRDPDTHINQSQITPCPIHAGCATVHHGGTLHYTPANQSSRPRRAYIFNFVDRAYLERIKRA